MEEKIDRTELMQMTGESVREEHYTVEEEIRSILEVNLPRMKGDGRDTVMYQGDALKSMPGKLREMLENCGLNISADEVIGFIDQKGYSAAVAFTSQGILFRKDPGRTEWESSIGETVFLRYDEIREVTHSVRGLMKQEYIRFAGDFSTCNYSVCELWIGCCGRTDLDWIRMKYCLDEIGFLVRESAGLHTLEEFKEARLKRALRDDLEEEDTPLDVSDLKVLRWSSEEIVLGFPESEQENVGNHEHHIKYALYLLGAGSIELGGFLGMLQKKKADSVKIRYRYDS